MGSSELNLTENSRLLLLEIRLMSDIKAKNNWLKDTKTPFILQIVILPVVNIKILINSALKGVK